MHVLDHISMSNVTNLKRLPWGKQICETYVSCVWEIHIFCPNVPTNRWSARIVTNRVPITHVCVQHWTNPQTFNLSNSHISPHRLHHWDMLRRTGWVPAPLLNLPEQWRARRQQPCSRWCALLWLNHERCITFFSVLYIHGFILFSPFDLYTSWYHP